MAPSRSKPAAEANDKDDSDNKPIWDSSDRNIQLHLQALKRWLPRQHSQFNNFIRYGYIINSRQEVVVSDIDHKNRLLNGTLIQGTFERPWRREEGSDDADSDDSEDGSSGSGKLRPLSVKKVKPTPTTEHPDTPSTTARRASCAGLA